MNPNLFAALIAILAGLATFLMLGAEQPDRGDEFIYGLVVGAIAFALVRYAMRKQLSDG